MPTPSLPPPAPLRWREGLALAALAAAVRLAHLLLGRADPSWGVPVVDADTYRRLAEHLAAGGAPGVELLWQPLLYPVGLAAVFALAGPSVLAARLVQIILGAGTCLAGWRLAGRWFGPGPARTAGLLIALCGPLVFFEAQLLAAGPAALAAVLLALVADRAGATTRLGPAVLLGATAGLTVLLRPTFGPAGLGLVLWLGLAAGPTTRPRARLRAAAALLAALAVLLPVELGARARFGHGAVLPTSGALNLYLGNNPDQARTLAIRPGLAWDALLTAPPDDGRGDPVAAGGRYYRQRVLDYVRRDPGGWLAGLGRKTLHLVSSRELPRNQDVYLHRQWSPVLAALVQRLGPWGLPTGLLLPLAVFGMVAAGGRRTVPGLIVLAGTGAALVLVFAAARYRAPLLPLLAVFAAAGIHRLAALRGPGRPRRITAAAVAAAAALTLGLVPGPFPQERQDLAGELEFAVGNALYGRRDWAGAEAHLRRAVELEPGRPEPRHFLALVLARTGRTAAAAEMFAATCTLAPDWGEARRNLERARIGLAEERYRQARASEGEQPAAAAALCAEAAQLAPRWSEPVARQAWYAATARVDSLRDGAAAVGLARRALALGPPHPYLQLVLAAALAESGRWDAALAAVDSGLALARAGGDDRWHDELARARERFRAREPLRR